MTSKRARARAALLEWDANTTPEMFVEEHKGIIFAGSDKSPKVELIDHNELFSVKIREQFESLFRKEFANKLKRSNSHISSICDYDQVLVISHFNENLTAEMVDIPLDVRSLSNSKATPDELNLKNYDGLISSEKFNNTHVRCC
ncbi:hypothetical protein NQ848_17250 [Acinetobacter baumannii]|nr:hypothetical protein [Acinetobacter baumannii]